MSTLPKPVKLLSQAEIAAIEMGISPDQAQRRVAAMTKLQEIEDRALAYAAYIASPEWRAKAEAIKARDGYHCRLCFRTVSLEVHHSTYERLGAELDTDLITLCHDCHTAFHERRRLAK